MEPPRPCSFYSANPPSARRRDVCGHNAGRRSRRPPRSSPAPANLSEAHSDVLAAKRVPEGCPPTRRSSSRAPWPRCPWPCP
eukprot:15197132-Heterocapsa_arctica.AAC.1